MGVLRVILLLLVLVCIGSVGVWVVHGDGAVSGLVGAPEARRAATPETAGEATSDVVHLLVLNGTAVKNLAGDFSQLVGRAGCVANRVDNAPHDHYARSLLINRRLDDERAQAVAARLGGPRVIREHDGAAVEDAVLVLGADHDRLREVLRAP
jgi:hypothetical protein